MTFWSGLKFNDQKFNPAVGHAAYLISIFCPVRGRRDTPADETEPGPATSGKKYEFMINAGRSHKLSFAVMLAATNDLFYTPGKDGIALYDDNGDPISGDVTDQV